MSVALLMSHPARVMAQTAGQLDSTVLAATTVQPDGWVHYSKTLVDELDLNGKSTHLVNGRLGIDGTCTIGESGTVEAGSLGHYSEPIASSMRTCQEIVVSGELTPSAIARLASAAAAGPKGLAPMTGTAIRPMTSSVFPLATATSKAYTGSRWVDPAFIVITALTIDLSWQRSGSSVPSAGYTIKPYEFAWDGWGNSGTPHPPFTFGAGFVSVTAHEQFRNTDFEQLLLAISAAIPGGPATVIAACGFDISPAIFDHTETLRGNANGGYNWSYSDTKKGGCSNLVHHDNYNGFGVF